MIWSATAIALIIEVPPTLPNVQAQIISLLALENGIKTFTKTTAKQLHFQGYGFFDLAHRVASGTKGHAHGSAHVTTLPQIHPVWSVVRTTP